VLVYAEPDDLMDGWLNEQPDDFEAKRAIRAASRLVRQATRCDRYEVDPAGLPVDLTISEAMRDATCAQAAMWITAGIDPGAGTAGREIGIASQSADGGSVTYSDSISAEEIERSLRYLIAEALEILRENGLASTRPDAW
jgi:hypothetical protein